MESSTNSSSQLAEHEKRLLERLSQKYESDPRAGLMRSYFIAMAIIVALFSVARWTPWWPLALAIVLVVGMLMFRQYKRFAQFKSRLLAKVWREIR